MSRLGEEEFSIIVAKLNIIQNGRQPIVVDGNRKQLQSVNIEVLSNVLHTLKVNNVGNHIQCWYDGVLYLDLIDDTFTAGKVGPWTKADAVTYFDDFEVEEQ